MNLDVDRFIKDMESVMKRHGFEDTASDDDIEEGSSSDLDFGMFFYCTFFLNKPALFNELLFMSGNVFQKHSVFVSFFFIKEPFQKTKFSE